MAVTDSPRGRGSYEMVDTQERPAANGGPDAQLRNDQHRFARKRAPTGAGLCTQFCRAAVTVSPRGRGSYKMVDTQERPAANGGPDVQSRNDQHRFARKRAPTGAGLCTPFCGTVVSVSPRGWGSYEMVDTQERAAVNGGLDVQSRNDQHRFARKRAPTGVSLRTPFCGMAVTVPPRGRGCYRVMCHPFIAKKKPHCSRLQWGFSLPLALSRRG